MTPDSLHDFFVAAAGVGGALIGLLFVAISIAQDRLSDSDESPLHRIRAASSLGSFLNALTVSLFALIPANDLGGTALAVGLGGIAFVLGAILSIVRLEHFGWRRLRDLLFLTGQLVTFVFQVIYGIELINRPDRVGAARALAILVIVCFLTGVSRAWRLVGGPRIELRHEIGQLVRGQTTDSRDGSRDG